MARSPSEPSQAAPSSTGVSPAATPTPKEAPRIEAPPALVLVKVSETRMLADGRPVSDAQLTQLLRSRVGGEPGLQVLIEAQPKVPHKRVAALFDLAKSAGAENIALVSGPLPKRAHRR